MTTRMRVLLLIVIVSLLLYLHVFVIPATWYGPAESLLVWGGLLLGLAFLVATVVRDDRPATTVSSTAKQRRTVLSPQSPARYVLATSTVGYLALIGFIGLLLALVFYGEKRANDFQSIATGFPQPVGATCEPLQAQPASFPVSDVSARLDCTIPTQTIAELKSFYEVVLPQAGWTKELLLAGSTARYYLCPSRSSLFQGCRFVDLHFIDDTNEPGFHPEHFASRISISFGYNNP